MKSRQKEYKQWGQREGCVTSSYSWQVAGKRDRRTVHVGEALYLICWHEELLKLQSYTLHPVIRVLQCVSFLHVTLF
jgi:hypothetical protein